MGHQVLGCTRQLCLYGVEGILGFPYRRVELRLKPCILHQRRVYVPEGTGPKETANMCADAADALLAKERLKGYRWASMPECSPRP